MDNAVRGEVETVVPAAHAVFEDVPGLASVLVAVDLNVATQTGPEVLDPVPIA